MNAQFFINEIGCNFNLRKPKSEKPTNVYFVARVRNKQIKLSTGVRVYPDQWNVKKQEAYISCRLTELDNENNTIVNEKISKLKLYFSEYKQYLCDHPEEIEHRAIILLKQYIYKDTMKKKTEQPATFTMKQIIEEKDIVDSSKIQYRSNINKFKRFLDENSIPDTWDSMNLDTFTKYQQFLVEEGKKDKKDKDGKKNSTIKNIIGGTLFPILRKASKRLDIPFKWDESNLDSFELVKDKSNKELARNKEVALTEEQIKQLYEYQPTGTEKQIQKKVEIRDLFVLQCLVGQRISDMYKFFNGDNERDKENSTISIIQKKTGAKAIIPLVPMAEEIINKYAGTEIKYYKEKRRGLNDDLRAVAQEAGLDEPVTYEENGVKCTKPLYELLHTHSARHTFSTIMCRKGVPREDIIIATGHENTQMLDKIYAHLTAKDKSKKVTTAFKKKLGDGIFNMGGQPESEDDEQTPVPTVPAKPKQKTDVFNHVFAGDLLLKLSRLKNKGIDITKLADTEEAVKTLKDVGRIDEIDKDKYKDNTRLRDKVAKIASVVWFIAFKRNDAVLIQMFQNNITELGLRNIFLNGEIMREARLESLMNGDEKVLKFVEVLNIRSMEELEEYEKRDKGR